MVRDTISNLRIIIAKPFHVEERSKHPNDRRVRGVELPDSTKSIISIMEFTQDRIIPVFESIEEILNMCDGRQC